MADENEVPISSDAPPDRSFALSRNNQIFLFVVAVVHITATLMLSDKPMARQVGETTGGLVALILLPTLISWIAWRFSGKNRSTGNVTFAVVLGLALLGQFNQAARRAEQQRIFRDMEQQQAALKQKLNNIEDPEEAGAAIREYASKVSSRMDAMAKSTSGETKQFFQIMSNFTAENQARQQAWYNAFQAVQEADMFDYSLLNKQNEYERQRGVVQKYIDETKVFQSDVANALPNLQKRLSVLGPGNSFVAGAMRGVKSKLDAQRSILDPLLVAHLGCGQAMLGVLDLLQHEQGKWEWKDEQLTFQDDAAAQRHLQLADQWQQHGEKINSLQEPLLRAMQK